MFLIDVIITAGIALLIALFLRLRETWAPSAMAFPGALLVAGASYVVGIPPVFGSIAFTVWICWLLGFTSGAAFMTALDLSGRRASPGSIYLSDRRSRQALVRVSPITSSIHIWDWQPGSKKWVRRW